MKKHPLYLIGFMASGKSKVGKSLSNLLDLEFIDLDEQIEAKAGISIPEIFNKEGEAAFREMEQTALKQTAGKKAVIALGGGTVCHHDNLKLVKQQGCSVYLNVRPETLYGRLRSNKGNRPLIMQLTDDELKDFIDHKLIERERFYSQADYVLADDNPSAKKIAQLIENKS